MRKLIICLTLFSPAIISAQSNPAVYSWIVNYGSETGFDGIITNVQQVQYSTNNVYVSTNSIPDWIPEGYDWPNNPWFPEAQNFVFKITLNPVEKQGNKISTPYGHIGLWTNGVSIYNPKDAKSWKDSSTWFQNALYFEHYHMETFDNCFGHPNNMHEYHTHVNPTCLYDDTDSTIHAPIIGYAFDGFPIYGAYGYSGTDGTGSIKRMRSSYRMRNITDRTVLPNGTVLPPTHYGPSLVIYPLGAYVEDFEYVPGLGDLDQYNGRFCKTPEYPDGIYAYFVTLNADLSPAYPYVLGPWFYGTVQPGNTGPNSGHNTINEPVQVYTSVNEVENQLSFEVYPNPASHESNLFLAPSFNQNMTATFFDPRGNVVARLENVQTSVEYTTDVSSWPAGIYILHLTDGRKQSVKKIMIQR